MSIELRRLSKYELQECLARGAQGEVWKAFDVQLRRFVAIKQLNAHLHTDPDSVTRFEHEARFIASLHHPNIVQIHDFQFVSTPGSNIFTAYMVMDYIEGPTLADYIRNTSHKKQYPGASDVISIFTAVSLALDYAHQKGMLHRDIKPANIMLDKRNPNGKPMGDPILMDFGIAKWLGGFADTTGALGTPLYMSPEQAQGLVGNKRSDLYSLGIILYEVMTGTTPFHSEFPLVILRQHCQDSPPLPALFNPAISPDLSAVILKSIAKDPDARFPSASAMTITLAEALNVAVPPELSPVVANEPDASNMLSLPSGMTPTSLAPSPFSPPQSFGIASPLAFIPPANGKQTPIAPVLQPSRKRPKKRPLYVALIVLLTVSGLGLASYALFAPKGGVSTVVGQVRFLSSKNAGGSLDEVQIITLRSMSDGNNYSAWLVTSEGDVPYVHWSFTIRNGNLSPPSYIDPHKQNLLTSPPLPYLFLITSESGRSNVPSFDPKDRLYYALIPQPGNYNAGISFDLNPCPQNSDSTNPCLR